MTALERKLYEVSNTHMINFEFEIDGNLENLIETKKRARETFIRDEEVLSTFVEACNSDDIEFGYLRSYLEFMLFEYEFQGISEEIACTIVKTIRVLTEMDLDAKSWLYVKIKRLGGANYKRILHDINLEHLNKLNKMEKIGM
ncbi:hypothetical protein [Enterococcus italicus]|uniref:hypothetical protein n=1 Tax=Enterococcus italicus TaxID=246144 RepID=UPI003F46FC02